MKNQTLSIAQMRHLKKLGVDANKTSMVIIYTDSDGCEMDWDEVQEELTRPEPMEMFCKLYDTKTGDYDHSYLEDCGVFTLQDIIDSLPKEIKTSTDTYWLTMSIDSCKEWYVCYSMSDEFDYYKEFKSKSLLNAAYNMLCWCAENGYLYKQ